MKSKTDNTRTERTNAEGFAAQFPLVGEWEVHYHDSSHLPADNQTGKKVTIYIGNLVIDRIPKRDLEKVTPRDIIPFTFALQSQRDIEEQYNRVRPKKGEHQGDSAKRLPRIIYGEFSDCLARTDILPPVIDQKDMEELQGKGAEKKALIFITDTNIIRRGVLSYLSAVFSDRPIWVIVPVISMLELQDVTARTKWTSDDPPKEENIRYLKNRPMSTCATRELRLLKSRIPVEFLEVPPELLRYYGGREPAEEKTTNILPDRLIIEGVKRIIKEKSTAEKIYLLSGDFDMVRFAKLENIASIYTDKRQLADGETFYSVHYDIYRKGFVACRAHEFLWDIAHVFSCIQLVNARLKKTITLEYYFPGRNVIDWEEDILEVTEREYEPAV